jgi:hypothetical protein
MVDQIILDSELPQILVQGGETDKSPIQGSDMVTHY